MQGIIRRQEGNKKTNKKCLKRKLDLKLVGIFSRSFREGKCFEVMLMGLGLCYVLMGLVCVLCLDEVSMWGVEKMSVKGVVCMMLLAVEWGVKGRIWRGIVRLSLGDVV